MTPFAYSVSIILLFASLAAAQVLYTITDLGVLSGDDSSQGRGISPSGQVVGYNETNLQGFFWSPSQNMLGLPAFEESRKVFCGDGASTVRA